VVRAFHLPMSRISLPGAVRWLRLWPCAVANESGGIGMTAGANALATRPHRRRNSCVGNVLVLCALAGVVVLGWPPHHVQANATFVGTVVAVQDGDTISVMRDGRAERVRVDGIDAPERGQDFGKRAKQLLSNLVFGKIVDVEVRDTDRYGRTVGRVTVDGHDAGLDMVRAGLAWHYIRYSNDPLLARAEREARAAHRGLWVQPAPLAPWEFRRSSGAQSIATLSPRASGRYHGNLRSRVFHAPGCQQYDCPNCSAGFESPADATAAGYRPHLVCVR
jgi:micrococcal nuclease